MRLFAFLFMSAWIHGMSGPQLVVLSADQTYTWYMDQEEVDQISSLRNQQADSRGASHLMLSPAVSSENFTQLLPFLAKKDDSSEVTKNKKRALASKTSSALAQFACDADCLGAERLLNRCLKILRNRIGTEPTLALPDTLQRALNEQVVHKNPFIKLLLFKAFAPDGTHLIQETVGPRSDRENWGVIDDYMVKRRITYDDGSPIQDPPCLFLYEIMPDDSPKMLQAWWNLPTPLQSCMAYEKGVVALHVDNPETFGYPTNQHIFFYESASASEEPRLFAPFRTCPTCMILNSNRNKIIAGSLEGEVGIFDLEHPEIEPQILGSVSNILVNQDKQVKALAIDSKDKHVAVAGGNNRLRMWCTVGIWSLKEKKYEELANAGSVIDDIKFGTLDDLLFVMTNDVGLQIWSIDQKALLYTVHMSSYEGPLGRKNSTLFIHPHDERITLYGHYAARKIKCDLLDEQTSKQLKYLPLSTIAALVRIGKKIHEGKQVSFSEEPDLKQLYRSVPPRLQKIIAQNVSWRDWMWL